MLGTRGQPDGRIRVIAAAGSARQRTSMVSTVSVAIGFSQKTCLPAAAHALIWSAWNCEGEQIQTASTSGWLMTSMASPVDSGTPYCSAAASAFDTVGFEMISGFACDADHRMTREMWHSRPSAGQRAARNMIAETAPLDSSPAPRDAQCRCGQHRLHQR